MLFIRSDYRTKKAMPARPPGRKVLTRPMLGRFRYGLFCPGKMDVNKAYSGLEGPEKETDGRRRMKRPGKINVNRAHIGLEVPEKEADGKRRIKRSGKIDVNRAYIGLEGPINSG